MKVEEGNRKESTFTKKVLPIKKGNDTLVIGPTFPNLGKNLRKLRSSSASLCLESLFACAEPALCLYIVFVVCPRSSILFFSQSFLSAEIQNLG